MQIIMLRSNNSRKGSYSYKGLAIRMEKAGITNYSQPKDCYFVYFECTREQYEDFRRRMYIYAGFMPWMYNTACDGIRVKHDNAWHVVVIMYTTHLL